jgi:hypothetical protein
MTFAIWIFPQILHRTGIQTSKIRSISSQRTSGMCIWYRHFYHQQLSAHCWNHLHHLWSHPRVCSTPGSVHALTFTINCECPWLSVVGTSTAATDLILGLCWQWTMAFHGSWEESDDVDFQAHLASHLSLNRDQLTMPGDQYCQTQEISFLWCF